MAGHKAEFCILQTDSGTFQIEAFGGTWQLTNLNFIVVAFLMKPRGKVA